MPMEIVMTEPAKWWCIQAEPFGRRPVFIGRVWTALTALKKALPYSRIEGNQVRVFGTSEAKRR